MREQLEGEAVADEGAVGVELGAVEIPRAERELGAAEVAAEGGLLRGQRDGAAGGAEASATRNEAEPSVATATAAASCSTVFPP